MNTHEIWIKYSEDLKRFILSKVKDEATADDILQDAFFRIHSKIATLKDASKLKPWVFTIARNTMYDHFKALGKTITFDVVDVVFEDDENEHSERDCLPGIIKNLPKKYRTPLFLYDIKGIKQQEIAAQLNLPLSTVKSQVQRGRKLIMKGYMDCCGYTVNEKGKLVGEIKEKEDCKVCK